MKLSRLVVVAGTFLMVLAGCGGGGGSTPPTPPATLTISTTSPLTAGTVGAAYTLTFAATGGTLPLKWSVSAGTLPAGLSLSTVGVLSGTPTAAATSTFTITATDSGSPVQTANLPATLVISAAPPAKLAITTTSPLTAGTVGTAYSLTLAATGGTTPYTWSVVSPGTGALPAGLTLSSAGVLSGTPTAAGTSTFTVAVTDSEATAQTATLAATLVINPAKLAISTTSPLTAGTVGTAYSLTLAATGGTTPITWTVSAGTLPAGLTLSTGVLSGTPTVAGTSTFTITATDSGSPVQTATLPATLVVNPAPIAITTTSPLPEGTLNTTYSATLKATGGTAPYIWSLVPGTGALPAGLTLTAGGLLAGTPTASGSSAFTVQVMDSESTPQSTTASFTLQIVVGTLAITSTSLPSGYVGTPYVAQLAASGGIAPYTWALTSGSLAGISLSTTGLLSGTPGSVTSTSPTFTVTDSASHSISASLPLNINAATGTVPDNYYSFVFAGTAQQGTPVAQNGIAINGILKIQSGQVVSGFYDENFNTNAPILKASFTGGNLVLGANGLGQLVLVTATNTFTFALASPASVSSGGLTPIRMIEYDDASGAGSRGSGVIDPTPAPPTTGAISGNFSFLLNGTDPNQNQQALGGSFQTDGAGHITGGNADANQVVPVNGTPTRQLVAFSPLGGTYSVDTDGRGTLNLTLGSAQVFHFSFYEVSPQEWLIISLDPATLNSPLVSGSVYQQTGGPFSTASLPATSVLEISGVSGTGAAGIPDITVGLATSDGTGKVTYTFDEYSGSLTTGGNFSVTYAVDATTGRAAVSSGTTPQPILYIINSTSAFLIGPDSSASSGIIEAQTGAPFTIASFSGDYLGGSLPLVLTSVLNESGLVVADGAGNVNFTTYRSTPTTPFLAYQNEVVVGTYTVSATGRGVITAPDGTTRIFYVVSPHKIAYLTGDTGGYLGNFQQ